MIPVTVMVTTRNEEANIDTCLRSVHGLVDQILVIDLESEDRTVPIARRYADDVYNLAYVYGAKYLLKLFRRSRGRLDEREQDTRVYVRGRVGRLRHALVEENVKESEILFYLAK